MKRRELIKSLALTVAGGGAYFLANAPASAESLKPHEKGLAVGQSLRYDDGLKLTFVGVRNDNRCPMGALCIAAGDAEVLLLAYVGRQPAKLIRVHTYNEPRVVVLSAVPPGMVGIPKSYSVRVGSLSPLPRIGKKLKQSDYRLVLDISVAV
ncbi:MAG: hypothetical protein ABIS50_14840 [Luteolibacter sp.]|uniref:hypothetical protein n=1 Tax=Luteolibacter sp. TaxID=1962973 RepID=UPI003265445C